MVRFDDGELEIAIATYNRPDFIKGWLEKCYRQAVERNIALSIYDSSPDDKTERIILDFNKNAEFKVKYRHVDSKTIIGYKPMFPILESDFQYLWVSGDARYNDFEQLDEKVFPYIKNRKADYIVINVSNNRQFPDMLFDNCGDMIHAVFIPSTCIGLSIYRMEIFDPIRNNRNLLNEYDKKFKDNYGFSWLGYFYNVYAAGKYYTLLANVNTYPVLDIRKTEAWVKQFYGCWADDLCQIIDNIPDVYTGKDFIPRETWDIMRLYSIPYCYLARKNGDLDKKKYDEIKKNGKLDKICDKHSRIRFFAISPMIMVEFVFKIYAVLDYSKRACRKIIRLIRR